MVVSFILIFNTNPRRYFLSIEKTCKRLKLEKIIEYPGCHPHLASFISCIHSCLQVCKVEKV